jgi:hypothetical protein
MGHIVQGTKNTRGTGTIHAGMLRHGIVEKSSTILTIFFFDFNFLKCPLAILFSFLECGARHRKYTTFVIKVTFEKHLFTSTKSVKYKVYKANSTKLGAQEMKNRQGRFLSLLLIAIFM